MHTTRQTIKASGWRNLRAAGVAFSLAAAMVLATGCASSSSSATEEETPEVVYAPQNGMTKEQIKTMYQGDPDSKRISSEGGEVWTYHTNAGEAFIPFNFGYRPEYHVIHFNADGIVTAYEITE
jgi:hypothetical protein